jgi:anti-sigma regulatory factor (Ser/Thr protein kinase)
MQITIKNRLSDIALVQTALKQFADVRGISSHDVMKINLIVDELISNIVSYAYQDDGEHDIEIELGLADNRLSLAITDDGVPFDPSAKDSPDTAAPLEARPLGGLGIHLVKKIADDLSYQRRAGKNVVTAVKRVNALDRN